MPFISSPPLGKRRAALSAAFPCTLPVLAGYWFLGMAYGVYMNVSGFSFLYPAVMSIVIFGGSLEFVAVSMLLSPFAPVQTLVMALLIQMRHLFYGISMLEVFKELGWKKFFLIYGMSDETFSVTYTAKVPEGIDRGWFLLWITLLDMGYWCSGALIGGMAGSCLTLNTQGLDFVLTAMFVTIFTEQWLKEKTHLSAYLGFAAALVCLLLFGADSFMVPTMVCILAGLLLLRRPMERRLS